MAALGQPGSSAASELRLRTLSALVLGAVAILTAWIGGWMLALVWAGAAAMVSTEWVAMTRARPGRGLAAITAGGICGLQVAFLARSPLAFAVCGAALVVALLFVAAANRDRAWALAGVGYAAPIALVPVALRLDPALGAAALLWVFAVVWTTDVAAYFTGRALGGPKLWPALSPRKTWSGFAGGLVGATLAGLTVARAAEAAGAVLPASYGAVALASALASVVSQAGDLAESAMKRRFGVKDSGAIIPGHGGAMDRLDGFAAVALGVGAALGAAAWLGRPALP